jgi:hypothetical protein
MTNSVKDRCLNPYQAVGISDGLLYDYPLGGQIQDDSTSAFLQYSQLLSIEKEKFSLFSMSNNIINRPIHTYDMEQRLVKIASDWKMCSVFLSKRPMHHSSWHAYQAVAILIDGLTSDYRRPGGQIQDDSTSAFLQYSLLLSIEKEKFSLCSMSTNIINRPIHTTWNMQCRHLQQIIAS